MSVPVYFVTGATGVVGSAVTEMLLSQTEARVALLIRAGDSAELAKRKCDVAAFCDVPPDVAQARVQAVAGDTSQPLLGLTPEVHEEIAATCTNVVHCAGAVRMNLSIEDARKSAVNGARNVVALLDAAVRLRGAAPKAELVSTVGVGGRLPGELPERWITEARGYHNTYEQSKAEAEVVLAEAVGRGLPITVHRPSMVVGDSHTGKVIHFQVFYHLVEFLSGQRTAGLLPDPGPTRLDLVASDHVARAIVESSRRPDTVGRIFHLAAGPDGAIPIGELHGIVFDRFRAAGIQVPRGRMLPLWVFRRLIPVVSLFSSERTRRALSTLPVFLDYLEGHQTFGNRISTRTFADWGLRFPPALEILGPVLDNYFARREERRSATASAPKRRSPS